MFSLVCRWYWYFDIQYFLIIESGWMKSTYHISYVNNAYKVVAQMSHVVSKNFPYTNVTANQNQ